MSRNFSVPPDRPLSDGVVTLRRWRRDDAPELVACLDGDSAISRYIIVIPQPFDADAARRYIDDAARRSDEGAGLHFAVVDAANATLLGSIDLRWNDRGDIAELGYWARAEARGRGVTTRALVLLSRWALAQPGVARLQLRAEAENVASCAAAERAGFRREGIMRSSQWNDRLGRRVDLTMYSLLPEDLA